MEPGTEEGMSMGTLVMILASIMFIGYIVYRISKQREELRNTVSILTAGEHDFVDGLESLVASGALKPVAA
jgi:flagellar biogenesis protein FliO